MSDDLLPPPYPRNCWCGDYRQFVWSDEFNVCRVCGTLVSRARHAEGALEVRADEGELYSKDYWLRRQGEKYGLPSIVERARHDLPERCVHWLRTLLARKPPGKDVRTLELGCAHGGFVALMKQAGYDAAGLEMSPWVVDFARSTFGIEVVCGPLEKQAKWNGPTFDAIILNDVIEHLPDPIGTLSTAAGLLKPDGQFLVQTPEYKEHLSHADLIALGESHTRPMAGKNEEHLFLFSRRSTQILWERLGFPHLEYLPALFPYDMSYAASRTPIARPKHEVVADALARTPGGRMVQALLDKSDEAAGLRAEIDRLRQSSTEP